MTTNIAGSPALQHQSMGDMWRQIFIVVATVSTLVINYLANALPINGLSTGEISDSFNVLFVPAGYVFSIWGIIYLGLIGYTVYQALPSQRTNSLLRAVGPLYLVSALANSAWIFLWHYEQFVLTIPVMLILLGSLIAVYLRLESQPPSNEVERWLIHVPFRIYLGWITVATVANFTTTLDWLNWTGWGVGADVWFYIMLATATVIGAGFALLRRDIAYVAVLVWAFVGIAVQHSELSGIMSASLAAALALVVLMGISWLRRPRESGV